MIIGVVDTTVVIHLFRKNSAAWVWLQAQSAKLSVTPITWLEVMHGAPGKAGQATCEGILAQFEMLYLTPTDMDWAMQQMKAFRLNHGVGILDCLIASVCARVQVPLYTHNLKHMQVLLPMAQVIKPY